MVSKSENNVLTIRLPERIDSASAGETEAKLLEILAENPAEKLVLDAQDMQYISSAGLRVVLRLKKEYRSLEIINASTDVYDIFEMTGFTEMMTITKAYRRMSVEGCEVIGKGAKGTVYRYNADTIVKVYNSADCLPDILNERELARKAFVLGIPTALSFDVVLVGDKFGAVFELLDAKSYSQLIAENPGNLEKYVREFAELLKKIHGTAVKTADMPSAKQMPERWLANAEKIFPAGLSARLRALAETIPEQATMVHGDYHTNNILMQNGETLLIDMDTLSYGHPVIELANIYITYVGFGMISPGVVENFLGFGYETACDFWRLFLKIYLGTADEKRLEETEKKIKILSLLRLANHVYKRSDEASKQRAIGLCTEELTRLTEEVESLEF